MARPRAKGTERRTSMGGEGTRSCPRPPGVPRPLLQEDPALRARGSCFSQEAGHPPKEPSQAGSALAFPP